MGCIYLLVCKPTGKCYVGQTINDPRTRWRNHKCPSSSKGFHLKRAIDKYGWNAFRAEVLVEVPNNELDEQEMHFVKMFDAYGPHGLNSTPGGQSFSPMLVPEVKQRRIDKMKEPEVRKNWLEAITTAQQRPEQKALLSQLTKERCKDPAHMQKRAEGRKRHMDSLDDEGRADIMNRTHTPQAEAKRLASFRATIAKRKADPNRKPIAGPSAETKAKRLASYNATIAKRREARALAAEQQPPPPAHASEEGKPPHASSSSSGHSAPIPGRSTPPPATASGAGVMDPARQHLLPSDCDSDSDC